MLTSAALRPGVTAVLVAATLAACSGGPDAPDETGEALAAALTAGDLPAGLFGGTSPQAAYDEVVRGLGETVPTVAAAGTEQGQGSEGERTAETTLAWTWDLGAGTWTYETTAALAYDETAESWQVTWDPALVEPGLEEEDVLVVRELPAQRGDILGAGGRVLVTERPVVRLGVDKTRVGADQAVRSARRVAALLDLDAGSYARLTRTSGPRAFVEAIVLRRGDAEDVPAGYDAVPGAVRIADTLPLAPTRAFAAPLLGRVGAATAEVVEDSDGEIGPGDEVGLSGLQARYDEQLRGAAGLEVVAAPNDGSAERTLFTADPVDGEPLRTTLDAGLQSAAERVLTAVPADVPAALVAVRPRDGAVLAAANSEGTAGQNIATFGQYAPGSTFKVVSTLALLRSGLSGTSPVDCPPSVVVDGKRFENYDDYPPSSLGRIPLSEAVAQSCNTAFVSAAQRVEPDAVAEAAEALGVGTDFDLGFPAYFGQVPPPQSQTEAAADLIGQGRVLASPMAMAAVAASVRSGGTVVPTLLDGVSPQADPAVPLTRAEADTLRALLRGVVTGGSGSVLAGLPGRVGAKTGTAEYGEPGPGGLPTHAWMIAFTDDLAVAAFVETGSGGSSTAGPLLAAFLDDPAAR